MIVSYFSQNNSTIRPIYFDQKLKLKQLDFYNFYFLSAHSSGTHYQIFYNEMPSNFRLLARSRQFALDIFHRGLCMMFRKLHLIQKTAFERRPHLHKFAQVGSWY